MINYSAKIHTKTTSHVIFLLYVGKDTHSRGLSGKLCMRIEEWEDFKKKVNPEMVG